jgi:CDGSH-type Zn-finger protein
MSDKVQVRFIKDGPIAVTGEVEVVDENGTVTHMQESTALCRCGASTSKPFCSGAHVAMGFKAPEGIPE